MKLSFKKRFHPTDGTVYEQAISVTKTEFNLVRTLLVNEVNNDYPRRKEYEESPADAQIFLKFLTRDQNLVYLNHTQTRFVNLFFKMPIKRYYNTLLIIKN